MTESSSSTLAEAREQFDQLIKHIRPDLHRYCARMIGSVVDAEDVVQDALAKAYYLLPTTKVTHLRGWLFRITHNKAIDFLRKNNRNPVDPLEEYPLQTELVPPLENEALATFALSIYLQLTPMQRSCVILKDVMGYSLAEVSEWLDVSVGAIKAALNRGRANLRQLAKSVDSSAPLPLDEPEASLLSKYVERFNARDFDAVRAMLADDVRLDLIEHGKAQGSFEVGKYFHNYSQIEDWHLSLGFVEGKPAILIADPQESDSQETSSFIYFIFIHWEHGKIALIRDYRYARYVMIDAEIATAQ